MTQQLLYREREAAALLGCSPQLVRRLAQRGELPFVTLSRERRFAHTDLVAYVERLRVAADIQRGGRSRLRAL